MCDSSALGGTENCKTCPSDCHCWEGQFCDPGNKADVGVGCTWLDECGNERCESGEDVNTCPQDCGGKYCGNKVCDEGEGTANCAVDCADICGNSICEPKLYPASTSNENCVTCPEDCTCKEGMACDPTNKLALASGCAEVKAVCGDLKCDGAENCKSCPVDCLCTPDQDCMYVSDSTDKKGCITGKFKVGDGICDTSNRESCVNSPSDCSCDRYEDGAGNKVQMYCDKYTAMDIIGDGCVTKLRCGTGTCETMYGENCQTCPQECKCYDTEICDPTQFALYPGRHGCAKAGEKCGNAACDEGETLQSCPADCKTTCGNGNCEYLDGENCKTCAADCGCQAGIECNLASPYADIVGCVADFCFNKQWDEDKGEEDVDCGGQCEADCSYKMELTPKSVTMYANGKNSQEFTIKATVNGKQAKGLKYILVARERLPEAIGSAGQLSQSSVTTDTDGTAKFSYTAPRTGSTPFDNAAVDITISGNNGDVAYVTLLDPKPKISLKADPRSVLEGEGTSMSYITITIDDPDSRQWSYKVDADLGKFIRGGSAMGELTTTDKTINVNWIPPESLVELVDHMMTLVQGQKEDWQSMKDATLKDLPIDTGLSVMEAHGDKIQLLDKMKLPFTAKVLGKIKGYYDQLKTLKGNWDNVKKDWNRIKTSTSTFERVLNTLSVGVEGLQAFYGTKDFVEGEMGLSDETELEKFAHNLDNIFIDYGCDSLQTGLRTWADLEREATLETDSVTVNIDVAVTDDEGFTARDSIMLVYTYHFNPGSISTLV